MQTMLYFVVRPGNDGDWRHPFATTDLEEAEREAARRAAAGYQVEAWPVGCVIGQPKVVREPNAA